MEKSVEWQFDSYMQELFQMKAGRYMPQIK